MVTYVYNQNKKVSLTPERRDAICADIMKYFETYYQDLKPSKEETVKILSELFPGTFKTDFNKVSKIPDVYEQFKTYTSALHRACTSSYDSMLDVEGCDLASNNLCGIYKASLIYDFNDINLMRELDEVIDDWAIKGEAAMYINWKTEAVRMQVEEPVASINPETGELSVDIRKSYKDIPISAAVNAKRIDPHNLYIDKTQTKNWEHCKKIYRDFISITDILANKDYDLTPAERKELLQQVKDNDEVGDLRAKEVCSDTRFIGEKVEVLEFEGDYMLPDSTEIIRRVEAVVIAGKYLAKFKPSEKPKSPIIWDVYMGRPDTGRGQSPLKVSYFLNQLENMCVDLQLKSWELNVVPTMLAPKGALVLNNKLKPGVPIEYDPGVLNGAAPQKLDFSSGLRGFDFADYFKVKMEGATGITQYMQGSQDGAVRTASEASYIHSGATMRMALESHLFNNRIILPLMRVYALYKKVYDTTEKDVRLPDGTYRKVTEEVRKGNYRFIIGGAQSAVEREAETNKLMQLLSLPTFQALISQLDVTTMQNFVIWLLNRMNFKETQQIFTLLGIDRAITENGRNMGVSEENLPDLRQRVTRELEGQVPDTIMRLAQQYRAQQQGG